MGLPIQSTASTSSRVTPGRSSCARRPLRVRADAGGAGERYSARGVSAAKEDVHAAIKDLDKGLFPKAFCKVCSAAVAKTYLAAAAAR